MLVDQVDGPPVCEGCLYHCPRPPHAPMCNTDGCHCECRQRRAEVLDRLEQQMRARQLANRPDAEVANRARDLEAEWLPTLDELRDERFGRPTHGAA